VCCAPRATSTQPLTAGVALGAARSGVAGSRAKCPDGRMHLPPTGRRRHPHTSPTPIGSPLVSGTPTTRASSFCRMRRARQAAVGALNVAPQPADPGDPWQELIPTAATGRQRRHRIHRRRPDQPPGYRRELRLPGSRLVSHTRARRATSKRAMAAPTGGGGCAPLDVPVRRARWHSAGASATALWQTADSHPDRPRGHRDEVSP
jgi:hypothetical protein